jgi:hypothetical protein
MIGSGDSVSAVISTPRSARHNARFSCRPRLERMLDQPSLAATSPEPPKALDEFGHCGEVPDPEFSCFGLIDRRSRHVPSRLDAPCTLVAIDS